MWCFFLLTALGFTHLLILPGILMDTCGQCILKTAVRWRMRNQQLVSVQSKSDDLSSYNVLVVET